MASAEEPEEDLEGALDERRQLAAAPGVGGLLDDLGLGRVGVNGGRDLVQTDLLPADLRDRLMAANAPVHLNVMPMREAETFTLDDISQPAEVADEACVVSLTTSGSSWAWRSSS